MSDERLSVLNTLVTSCARFFLAGELFTPQLFCSVDVILPAVMWTPLKAERIPFSSSTDDVRCALYGLLAAAIVPVSITQSDYLAGRYYNTLYSTSFVLTIGLYSMPRDG